MKLLMAFDSFKGTLTSTEAGTIAAGAAGALGHECVVAAVSDGGEGLTEAFTAANPARMMKAGVTDPLFNKIEAEFAIDGKTAVIECAAAAGLCLVPPEKRNPRLTTTYGLGLMIKAAMDNGARKIIIGLGGSATNDGGAGMAAALGSVFRRADGSAFIPTGGTLCDIATIDTSKMEENIKRTEFVACCDVTNPLCGPNGASRIYAPQKGASREMVEELERGMQHYSALLGEGIGNLSGSGAAGGLGVAVRYYLGGVLASGFKTMSALTRLEDKIKNADMVLTGEGCTDSQTENGKLPAGVSSIAVKYGKPCYIISGAVKGNPKINGALRIIPTTLEAGMPDRETAKKRLYNTVACLLQEV